MNQSIQYLLNEIARLEMVAFNLQKENEILKAEIKIKSTKKEGESNESTERSKSGNK